MNGSPQQQATDNKTNDNKQAKQGTGGNKQETDNKPSNNKQANREPTATNREPLTTTNRGPLTTTNRRPTNENKGKTILRIEKNVVILQKNKRIKK